MTKASWYRVIGAKQKVDNARGYRKYLMAKEYKEVAKYLFIIVEVRLLP
jgi:hypothetical protein